RRLQTIVREGFSQPGPARQCLRLYPGLSLSPPSRVGLEFARHRHKEALQERLLICRLVEKTETFEALHNVEGIPSCHLDSGKEVECRHGPLVVRQACGHMLDLYLDLGALTGVGTHPSAPPHECPRDRRRLRTI